MPNKKEIGSIEAGIAKGLRFCAPSVSEAAPRYMESEVIAPLSAIGAASASSLKASFWRSEVEETYQIGDPEFVSIALNTGGGRVWRNNEKTCTSVGTIAMQPFEGARWRFEPPVTFVHLYVPFRLLADVSECLFDRELQHSALLMPAGSRDNRVCEAASWIQSGLISVEPTPLLLDSWAFILAERLVRSFSRFATRQARVSFGKIPARGIAHVVDYIESNIGSDLQLDALARVAALSPYHFARRFKDTVGVSPHRYVTIRRIRHAQAQLKTTERGIADIAASCGFSNQGHLTNTFQRLLGVTPGLYRNRVR